MLRRTVIVLDNGASTMGEPAAKAISIRMNLDPVGALPKPPKLSRGSWSWISEAGCEFGRVAGDIYPTSTSVSFMATEPSPSVLVDWEPVHQRMLIEKLSRVKEISQPMADGEKSLLKIARASCRQLGTKSAHGISNLGNEGAHGQGRMNWGRIILISSRLSKPEMIAKCFDDEISRWNQTLTGGNSNTLDSIDHCELMLLSVASGKSAKASDYSFRQKKFSFVSETILATRLLTEVRKHLVYTMHLRIIRVTGLQMKGASDSKAGAHDVPLFCARPKEIDFDISHDKSSKTSLQMDDTQTSPQKYSASSATGTPSELVLNKMPQLKQLKQTGQLAVSATYRVTPVDLLNAATACLVKFLTANKICLNSDADPKKKSSASRAVGRLNGCTHVLIDHGGVIFLHLLDPSHTLIESCPPIRMCAGSAIPPVEYSVQKLGDLLRKYMVKPIFYNEEYIRPSEARIQLETEYFPLLKSQGLIFEYEEFASLIAACESESMDQEIFNGCINQMEDLQKRRKRKDPYCFGYSNKSKLRAAYSRIFAELAKLALAYRKVSPNHDKLATQIVQLVDVTDDAEGAEKEWEEAGWEELDELNSMTEREKEDHNRGDNNNAHFSHRGANPFNNSEKADHGLGSKLGKRPRQSVDSKGGRPVPDKTLDSLHIHRAKLISFNNEDGKNSHAFPASISSTDRRTLHEIAESLGLQHESRECPGGRQLVIWKKGHMPRYREEDQTPPIDEESQPSKRQRVDGNSLWSMHSSELSNKATSRQFAGWT